MKKQFEGWFRSQIQKAMKAKLFHISANILIINKSKREGGKNEACTKETNKVVKICYMSASFQINSRQQPREYAGRRRTPSEKKFRVNTARSSFNT